MKKVIDSGYLLEPSFPPINESEVISFIDYIATLDPRPMVIEAKHHRDFLKTQQIPTKRKMVEFLKVYEPENKTRDMMDWISMYNNRYDKIKELLQNRYELKNLISISRSLRMSGGESVSTIGMVKSVQKTQKGNIIIELEDKSSTIKVIFTMSKQEAYEKACELVEDEVVGISGRRSSDVIFADNLIYPDIPEIEIKTGPDDVYAAFIADIHVGSKMFLPKPFSKFTDWLNCKVGEEKQKEMASKIKYLFVTGDLVDGVGVYPNQEKELAIPDIYDQYEKFAELFAEVPKSVNVIICPGNHDALRLAEPQPALYKDVAKSVCELSNVTMVSNPAYVNIHGVDGFQGFDVLMYHGYSMDHYVANVEKLRLAGGYDRGDLIMSFLLKKRHLAPTHGSTRAAPMKEDFLIIDKVPDIFTTAHLHSKTQVGVYRNVVNIVSSCWQSQTVFQEKLGHHPDPGKVPIFNLKTRDVRMLTFI
jgi:DNA polymerase II small subunit